MTRCCVVGSPIAHTLSPVLHEAAYRALGLDWEYDSFEITEPELRPFLANLDESWRGISLTMPLKREAYRVVDEVDDMYAEDLRVVNTIVFTDDERRLVGYNTDVDGVVRALRDHDIEFVGEILVVGGGATAMSALVSIRQLGGLKASVAVRDPAKARDIAYVGYVYGLDVTVFSLDAIDQIPVAPVLVSTIPAAAQEPYADALVTRAHAVFDVVYDPVRTPLIQAAERAGKTTIGGFDLLLHQAARQVELMTECESAPLEAMRKEGLAALGNR
jgi:shikimate dehydrogenase